MDEMLDRLARRYDPTIDDAELFGTLRDARGLYSIIAAWREESWRNAEQLRHGRAQGAWMVRCFKRSSHRSRPAATAGAHAILAATLNDPMRNAARNAYCVAHA
jgi:hypothetical protein